MAILPIPPIQPLAASGTGAIGGALGGATGAGATAGVASGGTSGAGFSNAITNALQQVQQVQNTASSQAASAAAGQGNIADAMLATTQASVVTQVTSAVANKAVAAFTEIMNMQA